MIQKKTKLDSLVQKIDDFLIYNYQFGIEQNEAIECSLCSRKNLEFRIDFDYRFSKARSSC